MKRFLVLAEWKGAALIPHGQFDTREDAMTHAREWAKSNSVRVMCVEVTAAFVTTTVIREEAPE
jgi:hypothetical protein